MFEKLLNPPKSSTFGAFRLPENTSHVSAKETWLFILGKNSILHLHSIYDLLRFESSQAYCLKILAYNREIFYKSIADILQLAELKTRLLRLLRRQPITISSIIKQLVYRFGRLNNCFYVCHRIMKANSTPPTATQQNAVLKNESMPSSSMMCMMCHCCQ